jgi:hypothetical protein
MNNPLVEKVEPARARGTTTRASRARRCAAAAQACRVRVSSESVRSFGGREVDRPRQRRGRQPHNPERRVFRPRTKTNKMPTPRVSHGRNARTLMRVDRGIPDIERHLREVRSRLDVSLSVRDRHDRHARQRGGAVDDLLVGVLVHHRERMFWRFPSCRLRDVAKRVSRLTRSRRASTREPRRREPVPLAATSRARSCGACGRVSGTPREEK